MYLYTLNYICGAFLSQDGADMEVAGIADMEVVGAEAIVVVAGVDTGSSKKYSKKKSS